MSQDTLIDFSKLSFEKGVITFYSDRLSIRRGSLGHIDASFDSTAIAGGFERICDSYSNGIRYTYWYRDTDYRPSGYLFVDKQINRCVFIGFEHLLVLDTNRNLLTKKFIRCEINGFLLMKACGFSNPVYDYEKKILYYTVEGFLRRKKVKSIRLQ